MNDDKTLDETKMMRVSLQKKENQEKILCDHCLRSLSNNRRCIGMCVADSEY